LLQSSLGNALLYAAAGAKATIGLPEVIEREIGRVLPDLAEQAVRNIRRDITMLRQVSGHQMLVTGPTVLAITEGIAQRWKQLAGSIERIPFTFDQAQNALTQIIEKMPPCGENNEQFRDCCIWDAALTLGADRVIHLVSSDNAFFEGRKRTNGLAAPLQDELQRKKVELHLYPDLRDLLNALKETAPAIDEVAIGKAIVESVVVPARTIAAEKGSFELGPPGMPKINGYTTPKAALVAVSFEITFPMERALTKGDIEVREQGQFIVVDDCAYDPNQKSVSEIEIKSWTQKLIESGGFSSTTSKPTEQTLRQYEAGHFRIIS
jgi:hypothetical protein